jgi:FkbM family methyltransferase
MRLRMPWALTFARQYRPHLTWRSILALRSAVLAVPPPPVLDLRLRVPPTHLRLRPATTDLWTYDDVFCRQIYRAAIAHPIHTLLDVGANIGLVSLYVRAHSRKATIMAVEPDAGNLALLEHNLAPLHALIIRGALWQHDHPVTFAPAKPTTGHITTGDGITVSGYTMTSLVARSGFHTVDLLKIDSEGGERYLFAGDQAWLSRVRSILIEFHGDTRDASRFDQIVRAAGFVISEIGPQLAYARRLG